MRQALNTLLTLVVVGVSDEFKAVQGTLASPSPPFAATLGVVTAVSLVTQPAYRSAVG